MQQWSSGNESVGRQHWLPSAVAAALLAAGAAAVLWLNLAHVAACYRSEPAGTAGLWDTAREALDIGGLRAWAAILNPFQRMAFPWGVRALPLAGRLADPRHEWWMDQWAYAARHAIGAPASPRSLSDFLPEIGLNMFLFLALGAAPALLASDAVARALSGRGPERRPGTASWAPTADLAPFIRAASQPGSLPLGRVARRLPGAGRRIAIPLRDREANISRFSHATVWGVTEAGKTSGVYKPWLWTDFLMNDTRLRDASGWPTGAMSSVAIDMKHPDLFSTLAPYAPRVPRRLLILAPGDPKRSMHYNPLDFVLDNDGKPRAEDIQLLSDAIVPAVPSDTSGVSFHRGNEHRFADYLMQYVCEVQWAVERGVPGIEATVSMIEQIVRPHLGDMPMPRLRSLPMVAYLVRSDPESLLSLIMNTVTDPNVPDAWPGRISQFVEEGKGGRFRPDRNTAGWLQDLVTRFGVFAIPSVAQISDTSQFSLDLVGRQPCTLIIGMPATSPQSLESYSALIITQLLIALRRLAGSMPERRLPVPVTVYLDELANQGRIPRLEEALATTRDLGIAFVLGIQNTAQLEDRYGARVAASMLSNTNTKIVLGRNLGFQDAEMFARATGDTTVLAASASQGPRGGSLSHSETRRTFMTVDQIRGMRMYDALVFLQNGRYTRTRLVPFHKMERALRAYPPDPRYAEGTVSPDGHPVPPIVLHMARHMALNDILGHWDARPRREARKTAPTPVPTGTEAESAVAEIIDRARREPSAIEPGRDAPGRAGETGQAPEAPAQAAAPSEAAVDARTGASPDAGPVAQAQARDGRATAPATPQAGPQQGAAPPTPASGQEAGSQAASAADAASPDGDLEAVSSLAGLFNALFRGGVSPKTQVGPAPGWRARLPEGEHAVLQWSYVQAYGGGGSRAGEMARRWARAGFVIPKRVHVVTGDRASVNVIVFTPAAISRLTLPAASYVATWPEIPARMLRGLDARPAPEEAANDRAAPARQAPAQATAQPQPAAAAPVPAMAASATPSAAPRPPVRPERVAPGPAAPAPARAPKESEAAAPAAEPPAPAAAQAATPGHLPQARGRSEADRALEAVIAWARANAAALKSSPAHEMGQWEAFVQGTLALLVRQHHVSRLLVQSKFSMRAVLEEWRDTGVIIAQGNRFTVYTRIAENGQQGARFVAFRWDRLEAAGLSRD